MTTKGQLTVPAEVRRALGLRAGSRVQFLPQDDGSYRLLVRRASVRDLEGLLDAPHPVTLDQMDEAMTQGAAAAVARTPAT